MPLYPLKDDEIKSRESSGELPYTLKKELERRRIKSSHRRKLRMSAESEESFDDSDHMRLRSVTSNSGGSMQQQSRTTRRQRQHRLIEETHF